MKGQVPQDQGHTVHGAGNETASEVSKGEDRSIQHTTIASRASDGARGTGKSPGIWGTAGKDIPAAWAGVEEDP